MCKHSVILRDIISAYHPKFAGDEKMLYAIDKTPESFKIEYLVETAIEYVGGIKFLNEAGRDFDDNSDSKTATVSYNKLSNTYRIDINGLENKIGAIRISLYNEFKDGMDYFYIPYQDMLELKRENFGKNKGKQRLRFSWSKKNDHYNKYEKYRLPSFESMAKAKG